MSNVIETPFVFGPWQPLTAEDAIELSATREEDEAADEIIVTTDDERLAAAEREEAEVQAAMSRIKGEWGIADEPDGRSRELELTAGPRYEQERQAARELAKAWEESR